MAKWLHSGRRRDICMILYRTDGLLAQEIKTQLEAHYESRIEPKRFRSALKNLAATDYVQAHPDGIQDRYTLTDTGREALEAHLSWINEQANR